MWVVVLDMFHFTPIWGRWTHFDSYFWQGLKPPTSYISSFTKVSFKFRLPQSNRHHTRQEPPVCYVDFREFFGRKLDHDVNLPTGKYLFQRVIFSKTFDLPKLWGDTPIQSENHHLVQRDGGAHELWSELGIVRFLPNRKPWRELPLGF